MSEPFPVIECPRLVLRGLGARDVPALFRIFGDPEVMRYGSREPLADLAEAAAFLDEIHGLARAGTLFQWGVVRRGDDEVIGTCTLSDIDRRHRRAAIGYALGRDVWGQGLAGEATAGLVAWAFGTLGLHRLEADADPRNARSIRVLERLGFRKEGYQPERYFIGGEIQDAVIYGLLARDFRAG